MVTRREMLVDATGLDRLIEQLRRDGRIVIGPTVRDHAIVHDEIEQVADLPRGWTEEQQPGSYRLRPTNDTRLFGYSSPAESWKRFVFPPRSVLIRGRRDTAGITIERQNHDVVPVAFFGIRSCDLAALRVLDRVFLDAAHPDPTYRSRRADVFVVAVGCSDPGNTCFCVSMDTGPSPTTGFDLAVTELASLTSSSPESTAPADKTPSDQTIEYIVTSGSDRGDELLAVVNGEVVTTTHHQRAELQHQRASAAMGRSIDPADPPLAARDPEDPRWAEIAERCLACGNCTMVCPTCFCSRVEDTTSLDGAQTERSRHWDSCFTLDFSHMHGGSTRTSTASRYRQWLLHKLVTWHDQFDMSGCVGCGRCLTWCPVGIDLTVEVAALAQAQRAHQHNGA